MKSLKMFAIAVMAFAVMVMGVHAGTENVQITVNGKDYKYESISAALSAETVKSLKEVTVKVLDSYTETLSENNLTISKKVTLDLGGYTVTLSGANYGIEVKKGTLTVTGLTRSKIVNSTGSAASVIVVTGNNSHLIVDKDVTIEGVAAANTIRLLDEDNKAENSSIVIRGTVIAKEANRAALSVLGRIQNRENISTVTVEDGAKLTSEESAAFYQAGNAKTIIGKATLEGAVGIQAKAGTIEVNGATVKANGEVRDPQDKMGGMEDNGNAVQIESSNGYLSPAKITLNGGEYSSENNSAIAINGFDGDIPAIAEGSVVKGGAILSSAEGTPEISVYVEEEKGVDPLVANLEGFVKDAKFDGDLVDKLTFGDNGSISADSLKATLTKGSNVSTDGDGNTTVSGDTQPDNQQGNTGDANTPGTTPEDTNPNVPDVPKTNDNILVYASLGLVSALAVSFSAKRKENN